MRNNITAANIPPPRMAFFLKAGDGGSLTLMGGGGVLPKLRGKFEVLCFMEASYYLMRFLTKPDRSKRDKFKEWRNPQGGGVSLYTLTPWGLRHDAEIGLFQRSGVKIYFHASP
jgi:hypothetical protein